MMEITGTLKNAVFVNNEYERRSPCVHGQVYNDSKGRFCDGEWITTSKIDSIYAGGVIKTRFSAYQVEFAEQVSG